MESTQGNVLHMNTTYDHAILLLIYLLGAVRPFCFVFFRQNGNVHLRAALTSL